MVMGNSENLRVFNFAILLKSRKSRKLYAREILVFYIDSSLKEISGAGTASVASLSKICLLSLIHI